MKLLTKKKMNFETFQRLHANQLNSIPSHLWPRLHEKISQESFDAGAYFGLTESDHGNCLIAHAPLSLESDLFLIDHAWTFSSMEDARSGLNQIPGLLERLEQSLIKNREIEEEMEPHWDMVQLLADQAKCDPEDAWKSYKESDYQLVSALSVQVTKYKNSSRV